MSERTPTTQDAPLERMLAHLRTRKILAHIDGARVLDFGCGAHLWTLRALGARPRSRIGFDLVFAGQPASTTADGILVVGDLGDVEPGTIDVIVALACFEHIEPAELPGVLERLAALAASGGRIVGTVPTPPSRPVLELLSYRLGLIDRSQIEDHKVYYDRGHLAAQAARGGWTLRSYSLFQFGLNSHFELALSPGPGADPQ
jgi:SAM-dependent methyltransferase